MMCTKQVVLEAQQNNLGDVIALVDDIEISNCSSRDDKPGYKKTKNSLLCVFNELGTALTVLPICVYD